MNNASSAGLGPDIISREMADFIASDSRIRQLCTVTATPFVGMALWNWGVVLGLIWASEASASKLIYFAACLLIAGRQHAFLALTHEATHGRISVNRRWNDCLSDFLFAYPVFFDTDVYRRNHLQHHAHLNTEQDPDWVRKAHLPQWRFPMSRNFAIKTYPKFLLWNGAKEWIVIMLYFSQVLPLQNLRKREVRRGLLVRALYYGALAIALTYASGWGLFLKYWAFPLLFLFPSLQRVRSVAEHFGLARTHELDSSRNVLAPWYERMLFAPHNVHYHLAHHLVPAVPFYRLPRLQKILMESPVYRDLAHENSSYVALSARSLARDLFKEIPAESTGNNTAAAVKMGRAA